MRSIYDIHESQVSSIGMCYKSVYKKFDNNELPPKIGYIVTNAIDISLCQGLVVTIHECEGKLIADKNIKLSEGLKEKLAMYFEMEKL